MMAQKINLFRFYMVYYKNCIEFVCDYVLSCGFRVSSWSFYTSACDTRFHEKLYIMGHAGPVVISAADVQRQLDSGVIGHQ